MAGFPDIICAYKGVCFWIEVKRPGRKPTSLQTIELKKWDDAGALTMVAYSLDDVKNVIYELDNETLTNIVASLYVAVKTP
jgi:hypothetical protein